MLTDARQTGENVFDMAFSWYRRVALPSLAVTFVFIVVVTARAQHIWTIAGDGDDGYNGDGIPATLAQLSGPGDVATDAAGDIYISDNVNNRVRKVSGGTITTFAGTGAIGYNGDGIPASLAHLSGPAGIAVDAQHNVLITDMGNYRIRKVLANGTIITIAGTGRAPNYNGDWIPATLASLNLPMSVSWDGAGDVIIADMGNERFRKVFALNGTICTIAGNGTEGYNGDGIPATLAQLQSPRGHAVDADGNVYIADVGNQRVRKVLPNGTITLFAGGNGSGWYNGDGIPASLATVACPNDVALGSHGSILIADTCNDRVRRVLANGTITTIAGTDQEGYNGDGIPATLASLSGPCGVFEDALGRVFIADTDNNRIRMIDAPATTSSVAKRVDAQSQGAMRR